jgi:hypothetical protein
VNDVGEVVPVDLGVPVARGDRGRKVDRAQVARLVREQRLLAARVRRLDLAQQRRGVIAVHAVDEDDAGVARGPRHLDDQIVDLSRVELAHRRPVTRVAQGVGVAVLDRAEELLRQRDRDVEVGEVAAFLALDELQDVRMVDAQDAHVGAPTGPALLDGLSGLVEHAHERDGSRGHALSRAHLVARRPQAREREPRSAAGLVDDRGVAHRAEYRVHRVGYGKDEAGRELLQLSACVHQGR